MTIDSGRRVFQRAMRPSVLSSGGLLVGALLLCPPMSPCAHAFGGLWSSHASPVKQVAEEILFVDNPGSTVTAVVQITYEGPAQKFAWVIPMPGRPTVEVSSNTVFRRLDAATAPEYWREVTVEGKCVQPGDPEAGTGADASTDAGAQAAPDTTTAPVIMIDQGSVGPYDYATITIDPTVADRAKVATSWFTANGYDVTSLDREVLSPYLREGLNLLAFKLTKGTDTGAIRPVILTYESKLPMIPMRPAAVAAHDDMGIQVWVIGPSQAVPDNYRSLVINEARIDWLSAPKFVAGTLPAGGVGPFGVHVDRPSNYDAVVADAAAEAGGQGFVTELAGPASQYRDKVWSSLDDEEFTTIASQPYADGIDAILAANRHFGGWDGWMDALQGATTLPAGVTIDEFQRNPDRYRGAAKVSTRKFFRLLDAKVVKPVSTTAAMLSRAPFLTRLFSTMSPNEMTADPAFNYNFDLAQISNVHIGEQTIECSPTLNKDDAPWRIKLPQGGVIVGRGRGWPVAEGSMAANLEVVALSTDGPGTVVKDNREAIGRALYEIGGAEVVTSHGPTDLTSAIRQHVGGNKCSVSYVGTGTGFALALWSPFTGFLLARRRRRRRRRRRES